MIQLKWVFLHFCRSFSITEFWTRRVRGGGGGGGGGGGFRLVNEKYNKVAERLPKTKKNVYLNLQFIVKQNLDTFIY